MNTLESIYLTFLLYIIPCDLKYTQMWNYSLLIITGMLYNGTYSIHGHRSGALEMSIIYDTIWPLDIHKSSQRWWPISLLEVLYNNKAFIRWTTKDEMVCSLYKQPNSAQTNC